MHKSYSIAWALILVSGVWLELHGATRRERLVWLLFLAAVEAVAVVRRKAGDTASEHVWLWARGGGARAAQAAVFGVWIAWNVYAVSPAPAPSFVGPGLLALSLAAWLAPHFYSIGSDG